MAAVTAAMVKELRELTGAGMVDCKKSLVESDGNIEKAVEFLREKGLSAAAKKSGRIATEGLVYTYITDDKKKASIVEVNSETDFVAKNQDFQTFVEQVAKKAIESDSKDIEGFMTETWGFDNNATVKDALTSKIAVIGENLNIRRKEKLVCNDNEKVVSYVHGGGKVAVLLVMESKATSDSLEEAGKNICMQIAAMSPQFLKREEISEEFIKKEKEILTQQAMNEGKPASVVEKMIEGRLNKSLKNLCLLEQEYVKDDGITVKQYVENLSKELGSPVDVKKFVRFETGEGLEKKEENFAEEVNKAIQG